MTTSISSKYYLEAVILLMFKKQKLSIRQHEPNILSETGKDSMKVLLKLESRKEIKQM